MKVNKYYINIMLLAYRRYSAIKKKKSIEWFAILFVIEFLQSILKCVG